MFRSLKAVSDESQFQSSLDERLKNTCEEDFRETDFSRAQALNAFRDWIDQNPRICKCRYDDMFLLRFLRSKKYSMPEAQDSLERYILLRNGEFKDVNTNLSLDDPVLEELFNEGHAVLLPQPDKLGRRVLFLRAANLKPRIFSKTKLLRLGGLVSETLMESEEIQINGLVYLIDAEGFKIALAAYFTPAETARLIKNGEKIVPMRHKQINIINMTAASKFVAELSLGLVSSKMRERFSFPKSFDELENINPEILPKEYGGVVPLQEMLSLWKEQVRSMKSRLALNDQMEVMTQMYSPGAINGDVNALKKSLDEAITPDEILAGTNGTFRKLAVD